MKKVVLITGGSSGIGESTAIKMQENGWIVYAAARRLDRKEHLKAKGIINTLSEFTKEPIDEKRI